MKDARPFPRTIALLVAAAALAAAPASDAALLISDSFNTTNGDLQTRNTSPASGTGSLADRQDGSLETLDWVYAKAVHNIDGNRLKSNEASTNTGRVFLDHSFTDAAITTAGGFTVEYDFIPGDTSSDWIMLDLGLTTGTSGQAGTLEANGNLTSVIDFGLLIRNNGGFQVFKDNSGASVASGTAISSPTLLTPYHVEVTVETTGFSDGTLATVSAIVNGSAIDLNGGAAGTSTTFTWDADGTNYIAWESNQTVAFFDNVAISTIPTPAALPAGLTMIGLAAVRRRRRR